MECRVLAFFAEAVEKGEFMMRRFLRSWIVIIATGVPGLVLGQSEESFKHVTVSAGAGLTTSTGDIAGTLDHGGNIQLNGGYFFNRHFGLTGNFMFSGLGITRATLDNLNEPDGRARVYAVTADPTVRLSLGHGFTAYALAGGGYVRRTVEFTMPVSGTFLHKGTHLVSTTSDMVMSTVVDNSPGFDFGGGLNMPSRCSGVKMFVEARYFKGFTSNLDTTVVPITFGIRW